MAMKGHKTEAFQSMHRTLSSLKQQNHSMATNAAYSMTAKTNRTTRDGGLASLLEKREAKAASGVKSNRMEKRRVIFFLTLR